MKRHVAVLALSAMLLSGTVLCQAMPGPGEQSRPGCAEPAGREPFPAGLARILELSEAQKGKIQSIVDEERGKGKGRHEQEVELHKQLRAAERAATFDEQAVRSAASALAGLETERIVARARTHYRIGTVLTAAQRSLAERLLAERDERPAPPCGAEMQGRHGHGPGEEHGLGEGRGPDDCPGWR